MKAVLPRVAAHRVVVDSVAPPRTPTLISGIAHKRDVGLTKEVFLGDLLKIRVVCDGMTAVMNEQARARAETVTQLLEQIGMPSSASQSLGSSATVAAQVTAPQTTLPELTTSDDPGALHADLVVLEELGRGGMGVVHLARQRSLLREVAVKRLRENGTDGELSLYLEATVTGGLEHPNIVPVHALGRDTDGRPVMVMKRIEGVSLHALLRNREHPRWQGVDRETLLIDTLKSVCDAVSFAHSRGVIHRDIKPENVMLGDYGEVYLVDWGVAMKKGTSLPASAIAGTPAYMAPEMLVPQEGDIDERSDVFLIGATLHEALTGSPPYTGRSVPQVIYQAALCAPKSYKEPIAKELQEILLQCMHRDKSARFQSAIELKTALGEVQKRRAVAELVRAASDRIDSLDAVSREDPAKVQVYFYECRFALEQALREVPDYTEARIKRDGLLEWMFTWHVAQKNRAAAAALATSLGDRPDHTEALARLDEEFEREAKGRERLAQYEYDSDLEVGVQHRRASLKFFAMIVVVLAAVFGVALVRFHLQPSPKAVAMLSVLTLVIIGAVGVIKRKVIFSNRVSRQLGGAVLWIASLIVLHRLVGTFSGQSMAEIAPNDGFIAASAMAILGLTVRKIYLFPAVFMGTAGVVLTLYRGAGVLPGFVAMLLSIAVVIAVPPKDTGHEGRVSSPVEK